MLYKAGYDKIGTYSAECSPWGDDMYYSADHAS